MAKLTNVIGYGTHADRPAAGAAGALYCESDTGRIYRDNGTGWDQVATQTPPFALTVQVMSSADVAIAAANTLLINTGSGHTATLPLAASCPGQMIVAKSHGNNPATLATAGSDVFDNGATTYFVGGSGGTGSVFDSAATWLVSDGAVWHIISHMQTD